MAKKETPKTKTQNKMEKGKRSLKQLIVLGKTRVAWKDFRGSQAGDDLSISSVDRPAENMQDCLSGLLDIFLVACEMAEGYAEGMRVAGVKLKYQKGGKLDEYQILVIKTLHTGTAQLPQWSPGITLEDDVPQLLAAVCDEAWRYVDNERSVMDLDGMDDPPGDGKKEK